MKKSELKEGVFYAYKGRYDRIEKIWFSDASLAKKVFEKGYVWGSSHGNQWDREEQVQILKTYSEKYLLRNIVGEYYETVRALNEESAARRKARDEAEVRYKEWRAEFEPVFKDFQRAVSGSTGRFVAEYDEVRKLPISVLKLVTEVLKEEAAKKSAIA